MKIISYFLIFICSTCCTFSLDALSMEEFIKEFYYSDEHKEHNYPMLTYAISKNYKDIALHLLEMGENPNEMPKNSYTSSLCQAIFIEDEELVEFLLDLGADVNRGVKIFFYDGGKTKKPKGWYPLLQALYTNKYPNITKLLLERGAKLSYDDSATSENPLLIAALKGDSKKFFHLIDFGADIFQESEFLMLHVCAEFKPELFNSKIEIAQYLLDLGVQVNYPESDYCSPLGRASASHWPEMVNLLLLYGADVNHMSPTLRSTSSKGNYRSVLGEAINMCTANNKYFMQNNAIETIKILINSGAVIDQDNWFYQNFFGEMTEQYAWICSSNKKPLGFKGKNLMLAMIFKNYETAKFLVESGADLEINPVEGIDYTYLQIMIKSRDEEGTIFLIENGVDPENRGANNIHPLDLAISNGMTKVADALITAIAKKYK